MLSDELKKIGLNKNEIKVYLSALELGEATTTRLSQKSKVKRTTVYLVTDSLKGKGLISSVKRAGRTLFFSEDPRKIVGQLEDKKEAILRVMPELLSLTNLIDKKPVIRYFEGKEGIKEVFKETLLYPSSELLGWFPDQVY